MVASVDLTSQDADAVDRCPIASLQVEAVEGGVEVIDRASGEIVSIQSPATPSAMKKSCCEGMKDDVEFLCKIEGSPCMEFQGIHGWSCQEDGEVCVAAYGECLYTESGSPACEPGGWAY